MSDSLRRVMNGNDRGEGTQKEKKLVQEKLKHSKVPCYLKEVKCKSCLVIPCGSLYKLLYSRITTTS